MDGVTSAATDALGHRTSFSVDAAGRAQETVASDGGVSTVQYDAANQVLSTKNPLGIVTTYKYDKTDRLTEVTRGTVKASYGYDTVGRLKTQTQPGGVVRTSEYDLASALTGLTFTSGSQVVGDVTYHYDAAGRPTGFQTQNARPLNRAR